MVDTASSNPFARLDTSLMRSTKQQQANKQTRNLALDSKLNRMSLIEEFTREKAQKKRSGKTLL